MTTTMATTARAYLPHFGMVTGTSHGSDRVGGNVEPNAPRVGRRDRPGVEHEASPTSERHGAPGTDPRGGRLRDGERSRRGEARALALPHVERGEHDDGSERD